ncbi:hypothetical protein F2Q70_00020212 [Brassica cretica]|uniref:Uncharacterized protein n=1 Tax=Brassica cretica TaxID=69181 RepID=A0A8S9GQ29_BRACR|nr:hypothetical protein F2Q70_00020212 [Brassica cretica]
MQKGDLKVFKLSKKSAAIWASLSKRPARNASTLSLYTRPDRQDQQTKDKQRIILAPTVDIDSLKVEIITVSSMRFNI